MARRIALGGEAPGPKCDHEMLDRFEQSLPTKLRLAVIWPMALLGVLLIAYCLANFFRARYSKLLGDLTTAAVSLDRKAAVVAFTDSYRRAAVSGFRVEAFSYAGATIFVAWSAMLMIIALLPAFAIKRKLFAEVMPLEKSGFAALGVCPVHDTELDLLAYALQVFTVALIGAFAVLLPEGNPSQVAVERAFGGLLIVVTVLAIVELRSRFAARRAGFERRHGRLSRLSLRLVTAVSIFILVELVVVGRPAITKPAVYAMQVGDQRGWFREVSFRVTAIKPDAPCQDPYRPLKQDQQFLRFDLETWSTVDQFVDPGIVSGLNLRHWSVANSRGKLQTNLYMYAKCGDGTEPISQPITPGAHTRTVVVVNAPKPAKFLQLYIPNYYGIWRWPIPAANG
ncbi:hypothetical protein A5730_07530 [Mycobacterium sp. ACS4054]|nr:hypothetical protein A5730_07530 [Mycobacterium sp. ACS4054]